MLPSRTTLRSWNPDALAAAAGSIDSSAESVANSVTGIDEGINRMPETNGWSGQAHDAATTMFGRADKEAAQLRSYAHAVSLALKVGSGTIGSWRAALLAKADELDAGPLNVTDAWVVLIDPQTMTSEQATKMHALALAEQDHINGLLISVGDADDRVTDSIVKAGNAFGYIEAGSPTDLGGMMMPSDPRPGDQVPDPLTPLGQTQQEAIRDGDMSMTIREIAYGTNTDGEEVKTVWMQDGSSHDITTHDPFLWPSKHDFIEDEHFDKNGNEVSSTSSWLDLQSQMDYTSYGWPDGTNVTSTRDRVTGEVRAGIITATGKHRDLPVDVVDNLSNFTGGAMSGLEKHIEQGGGLPMLTAQSVDDIGKSVKYGGPALAVATTIFDMAVAETGRDRCAAVVAGAMGFGGGWAGAEIGAATGAVLVPFAWATVPAGATVGAILGGAGLSELGTAIGEVACPY